MINEYIVDYSQTSAIVLFMVKTADKSSSESYSTILKAAENRFSQYGFNKTTMAEIAHDCKMSASNIYRFFPGKLDIAAALASKCLEDEQAELQLVVSDPSLTATEKLRKFINTLFDLTYTSWSENPRMNEMVVVICHERMDIVDKHIQIKHALLITLLRQGVDKNEFLVKDLHVTAEAISTTLTLFGLPTLMNLFTREVFERKAQAVFELILNGLKQH